MIRINLLPTRKARPGAAEEGKLWIVFFLLALVVEAGVITLVHIQRSEALAVMQRRNADKARRIDQIKQEVADHDEIKKQLEDIQAREDVISKLRAARSGPVYVMMELSKVLSPNQLPTTDPDRLAQIQRDNPMQAPNLRWDSRRLWLTEFKEEDRAVVLRGAARGHDDVAEFLRRLILSDYFTDEQLRQTEATTDRESGLQTVAFEIRCNVRYQYMARKRGFGSASTGQKALVLLILVVVIAAGYWVILYRSLSSDLAAEEEAEIRLTGEERSWVAKQATYNEDKKELNAQRAREREQLKILPNETNMDSFLDNLNGLAELAGLQLEATVPGDEEPEDFYARVPVALRLSGRYHQVAKFFYNVSRLDRIINMENIEIAEPQEANGEIMIQAKVLATTFRALPAPEGAPAEEGGEAGEGTRPSDSEGRGG